MNLKEDSSFMVSFLGKCRGKDVILYFYGYDERYYDGVLKDFDTSGNVVILQEGDSETLIELSKIEAIRME